MAPPPSPARVAAQAVEAARVARLRAGLARRLAAAAGAGDLGANDLLDGALREMAGKLGLGGLYDDLREVGADPRHGGPTRGMAAEAIARAWEARGFEMGPAARRAALEAAARAVAALAAVGRLGGST